MKRTKFKMLWKITIFIQHNILSTMEFIKYFIKYKVEKHNNNRTKSKRYGSYTWYKIVVIFTAYVVHQKLTTLKIG